MRIKSSLQLYLNTERHLTLPNLHVFFKCNHNFFHVIFQLALNSYFALASCVHYIHSYTIDFDLGLKLSIEVTFNPLSANPTKWSNTLNQFVSKLPTNCLSVFDHFVKLLQKGLSVLQRFSECKYHNFAWGLCPIYQILWPLSAFYFCFEKSCLPKPSSGYTTGIRYWLIPSRDIDDHAI